MEIYLRWLTALALLLVLTMSIFYSIQFAIESPTADFAAFYCAGSIAINPEMSNASMYDQEKLNLVAEARSINFMPERYYYSIPVAYMFSPLTFFSYSKAKIIFNILSLLFYLFSIIIMLKDSRLLFLLITLSFVWVPLFYNQAWLQSNNIVLLMVTLAVLFAEKNKPKISGLFLGIAVLIKLFPIAIAMIFGIKNWRILLSCIFTFCLSLLIPGSSNWFSSIAIGSHPNYTQIYTWLSQFGPLWYVFYVCVVAGVTALASYRARHGAYQLLASIAVPTMLLTSPVVGGYYLVLLIISFIYIALNVDVFPAWICVVSAFLFCLINYTMALYDTFWFGLFTFWLLFIYFTYLKIPIRSFYQKYI